MLASNSLYSYDGIILGIIDDEKRIARKNNREIFCGSLKRIA